jgi:Glycosyltransferase family 87
MPATDYTQPKRKSILPPLYPRLVFFLERRSAVDGRIVLVAMVLTYLAVVGISSFVTDYRTFWARYLGVNAHRVLFTDLGLLPTALVCAKQGYDPYLANPCDPFGHLFNYPRVWLWLTAVSGFTLERVHIFGPVLAILFFASVVISAGKLTAGEGLITGVLLCSPAIMFGVERGNIDLFMFSLVAVALLLARRGAPSTIVYAPLVAAAVLKLFPAATFCISLREPTWKRKLTSMAALAVLFGVYVFWFRTDIMKIAANTLTSTHDSFGSIVVFRMVRRACFPHSDLAWKILRLASYAAVGASVVGAFFLARRIPFPAERESSSLDSFRAGSSIYVTAFAIASNWDYRLVFLLFTLPQLFVWVKSRTPWGCLSAAALGVMVIALWISSWSARMAALDEVGNWLLFIYFLVALMITMPHTYSNS